MSTPSYFSSMHTHDPTSDLTVVSSVSGASVGSVNITDSSYIKAEISPEAVPLEKLLKMHGLDLKKLQEIFSEIPPPKPEEDLGSGYPLEMSGPSADILDSDIAKMSVGHRVTSYSQIDYWKQDPQTVSVPLGSKFLAVSNYCGNLCISTLSPVSAQGSTLGVEQWIVQVVPEGCLLEAPDFEFLGPVPSDFILTRTDGMMKQSVMVTLPPVYAVGSTHPNAATDVPGAPVSVGVNIPSQYINIEVPIEADKLKPLNNPPRFLFRIL